MRVWIGQNPATVPNWVIFIQMLMMGAWIGSISTPAPNGSSASCHPSKPTLGLPSTTQTAAPAVPTRSRLMRGARGTSLACVEPFRDGYRHRP
jgi:hypothetical protein